MKIYKLFAFLLTFFLLHTTYAQTSKNGIYIQALTRDRYSNPSKNRLIYVQSSILQSSVDGIVSLKEEFKTMTDSIGIFNISVGQGNRIGGIETNLSSIPWSKGPFFLNLKISIQPTDTDPNWDYTKELIDIGTTPFGTVPYALYSDKSEELNNKVNLIDSNKVFITPFQLSKISLGLNGFSFDSTSLSNRINSKVSNVELVSLSDKIASNTISITNNIEAINNKANIYSPIFTGAPNFPSESIAFTQNINDSSSKLATTEFVKAALVNIPLGLSSIGPISTISNINAATISGTGQLILTPADANNGGIVSTGDQIFSGNKSILGNLLTSGQITTGSVTYPNTDGSDGQFLSTNGSGIISWQSISSNLPIANASTIGAIKVGNNLSIDGNGVLSSSGLVPYSGATESVDLGAYDLKVNGLTIGRGANIAIDNNTALGTNALMSSTNNGERNTAVGYNSIPYYVGTGIGYNTSVGYDNMFGLTTGLANTSIGAETMFQLGNGSNNTAIGNHTLLSNTGSGNTAVGSESGNGVVEGSNNTFIGLSANVSDGSFSNATAIGNGAIVSASNSIQLGNSSILKVKTSGSITSGAITFPNIDGLSGQFLSTNGSGIISWQSLPKASVSTLGGIKVGSNLSIDGNGVLSTTGLVPYSGATGSVNLGGYDLKVNGLTIGRGANNSITNNTALGFNALVNSINNGERNTAVGFNSMQNYVGTGIGNNTSVGYYNMQGITTGVSNTSIGVETMMNLGSGSNNTAVGKHALLSVTGNLNTAIGVEAGNSIVGGSNNTILGANANVSDGTLSNTTAIGNGAIVTASNNIQLGNTNITNVKTSGKLTLGSITFPNSDGLSGQLLSTNGSGIVSWQSISTLLPKASVSTLGVIKVGSNLSVDGNGVLSTSGLVPYTGATGAVNFGGYDLKVNGLTIGRGANNAISNNTALGINALMNATSTGEKNTAVGYYSMANFYGIGATNNTSVGYNNMLGLTTGNGNTSIGGETLLLLGSGSHNTAIGNHTFIGLTGSSNTAVGSESGNGIVGGTNNTFIGESADASDGSLVNATAIGSGAIVSTSNTIQLGNSNITNVITSGSITSGDVTFPNYDGTPGDILTTNGSGIVVWNSRSAGVVPYSGAVGQVNLGNYDLIVNGLTIGRGANSTIDNNTALGYNALMSSTNNGERNTAVGYNSIPYYVGTDFGNNTSVGYDNMFGLTTGLANTSIGAETMFQLGNGSNNTAIGNHTLLSNTGSGNTAVGSESGNGVVVGSNNTFIGLSANVSNGSISNSTAIGNGAIVSASNSIQLGNSNITNVKTSGKLTLGSITFPNSDGVAGQSLTTDGNGTISWQSGGNSAVGLVPYSGATGAVDLGNYDLSVNGLTIGRGANSAINNNTALGTNALMSSTNNGERNTAVGYNSMPYYVGNGVGSNTSVGYDNMLGLTTGEANTSIGGETMFQLRNGSSNTAIGNHTLLSNTGSANTAVGAESGNGVVAGSNNTFLGVSANVSDGSISNATAIGIGAIVTSSNTMQLGGASLISVNTGGYYTGSAFTTTSDKRLKTNIIPVLNGVNTVMLLNPVHYEKKSSLDSNAISIIENGFIAQEIRKIMPFIVKEGSDKNKLLSLDYTSIIPILTRAIQEQQSEIENQRKLVNEQDKKIKKIEDKLERFFKNIN